MSADNKTDALREALAWALTQLPDPIWPGSYKDRFEAAQAVLAADHFEDVRGMVATSQESRQVEPVAFITGYYHGYAVINSVDHRVLLPVGTALYRAPQKRKPLTESFLEKLAEKHVTNCYFDTLTYAREIESLHGIGGEE